MLTVGKRKPNVHGRAFQGVPGKNDTGTMARAPGPAPQEDGLPGLIVPSKG